MTRCFDCAMALRSIAWHTYTANCTGCMDRALAGLKTLPPLEPPPKPTEDSQ